LIETKPHISEDVSTWLDPGTALIVHPNNLQSSAGYLVLGDFGASERRGPLTGTPR
jgi:hypothetical protein